MDVAIARYRRLREQVSDQQVHQASERLVAELEAKKASRRAVIDAARWLADASRLE